MKVYLSRLELVFLGTTTSFVFLGLRLFNTTMAPITARTTTTAITAISVGSKNLVL